MHDSAPRCRRAGARPLPVGIALLLLGLWLPPGAEVSADPTPAVASGGRFHVYEAFPAARLGGPRRVTIFLPPDYATAPQRRYPVLYLHDGQNVFDAHRAAFGVEWRVDETLDGLVAAGKLAPVIAVAVDHAGSGRVDEYTPPLPGGGGGKATVYGDFLALDLKPFVDAHYRTLAGPSTTAVMGSSLGGILSLHVARLRPQVFGRAGCLSPSFWWNDGQILSEWHASSAKGPSMVWIDIGTAEGSDADHDGVNEPVEHARLARDLALARGYVAGKDLGYYEDPGAKHTESAWAGRLSKPLLFLLGSPTPATSGAATATLTFSVTVPGNTPPGDTIYLSGNLPELGGWNPAGVPLTLEKGKWKAKVTVPRAADIQFKFTRGSWETVEKDAHGHEMANRVLNADRSKTVKAAVARWRED